MDPNLYDDAAILTIYQEALKSHQTKQHLRGEFATGGMSRKQKKKTLKFTKLKSKDNNNASDANLMSSVHGYEYPDLSHLEESNRSFVQDFLTQTECVPDPSIDEQTEHQSNLNTDSVTSTAPVWSPLQGGPYHNCQIVVNHHHHYHDHFKYLERPASMSEEHEKAWYDLCVARDAYCAALQRFENVNNANN